jgi:hypothetical protein
MTSGIEPMTFWLVAYSTPNNNITMCPHLNITINFLNGNDDEIKRGSNLENVYYHSVYNLPASCVLS